jgi:predicted acyl esterase
MERKINYLKLMFLILEEKNGKHTMRTTAKYSKTRFLCKKTNCLKWQKNSFEEFVSDQKTCSFLRIYCRFYPRKYMTDDQRFAAKRQDVIVFETEVLADDMSLAGEILAKLQVSTTGTDDWIVESD